MKLIILKFLAALIVVVVVPGSIVAALMGDINRDGSVTMADFQSFLTSFGSTTCGSPSDLNGDCKTNIFDYNLLIANFGKSEAVAPTHNYGSTAPTGSYNFGAFRPGQTLIEIQAWWNPIPDDGKGFGHEHILCWWPLGKRVTDVFPDGIIRTNCRLTMHNNPSTFKRLVFHLAPGNEIKRIETGDLRCPYDGVNNQSCSWNIPVELDTRSWPEGWRHLRVRAVQETADGKIWTTSSEIPMQIGTGTSGEYTNCRSDGVTACFRGKSWYPGMDYQNVEISGVPLAPVRGTVQFHIKPIVGTPIQLAAFLDRSHHIPATGPWPQEPALPNGPDLTQQNLSGYSVSIDTTRLSNGWHSFAARSVSEKTDISTCPGCTYQVSNPNHQTGIAKFWFYVQN